MNHFFNEVENTLKTTFKSRIYSIVFLFYFIITFRRVKWIYLIDWIDSGNFAAFAVIGVGVNVAVQFQRNAVNGSQALVLVQDVIFLHHLVGDILIQLSRFIIKLLRSFYSEFFEPLGIRFRIETSSETVGGEFSVCRWPL